MKFRLPFTTRSIEIRASKRPRPSEWDDFWYSVGTGETTKAGVDVSEDTALTLGAVWACVRVISEDLASLPLFVYRRQGKSKERAMEHPCYRLLHDAPNPEMSAMQFREALMAHVLLWGNCYAEIQRNLRGEPIALWPLRPDKMEVERDESNQLRYVYSVNSEKLTFAPSDILHVAGLGCNGLVGYSVINYHKETIGLGLAANEFGSRFFAGDATPRMVLKHPGFLKEEAHKKLRDRWQSTYGGSANSGKVAVLEEGMDLTTVSIPNSDAQYLETRKFEVSEIARIYRVPPHKIGDLERATFSNIEHQGIDYVVSTIRPWAVRWEQAINQRLLGASDEYFAEHLVDGLLRGDLQSRYSAYAVGRQWGWLSVNDIRSLENLNPVEDGDDYLMPMNMTVIGEEPEEPEPEEEKAGETEEISNEEAVAVARALRVIKRMPQDKNHSRLTAEASGRMIGFMENMRYDPDQPRDETGKWTSGGGGGGGGDSKGGGSGSGDGESSGGATLPVEHGLPRKSGEPSKPKIAVDPDSVDLQGNKISPRQMERVVSEITSIRTDHVDGISSISVVNLGKMKASGAYDDQNNAIAINPASSPEEFRYSAYHEIGHHVHLAKMKDISANEWAEISQDGKNAKIRSNARANRGEHFADAYASFRTGGDRQKALQKLEPKAYGFMEKLHRPSYGGLFANGFETPKNIRSKRYGSD